MQLGKTTSAYKKLGVHIINKVAQNGDIVNGMIRKKYPGYKAVTFNQTSINKLIQQTYMYEKFHFIMFVFFGLTTAYAIEKSFFGWAAAISVSNLFYNIYPNLLQQYIRLKLTMYRSKLK